MIIKKNAILILTIFLVSANAGEGSKQGEQIGTATWAETSEANMGSSDVNTQRAWLNAILGIWKIFE